MPEHGGFTRMLREVVEQIPDRDELLGELGLERKGRPLARWLRSGVWLGAGLALGITSDPMLKRTGLRAARRTVPASASVAAGALAGVAVCALLRGVADRRRDLSRRETPLLTRAESGALGSD